MCVRRVDNAWLCLVLPLLWIALTIPSAQGSTTELPRNLTCSTLQDCQPINGSVCAENHLCACPKEKPVFVDLTTNDTYVEGYCLEAVNHTGGNCSFNQQCVYSHGTCTGGSCGCEKRYEPGSEEEQCRPIAKSNLIPIAVGGALGVAVLITLVAYFWMSRKKK